MKTDKQKRLAILNKIDDLNEQCRQCNNNPQSCSSGCAVEEQLLVLGQALSGVNQTKREARKEKRALKEQIQSGRANQQEKEKAKEGQSVKKLGRLFKTEIDEYCQLVVDGKSAKEIAEHFGVDIKKVYKFKNTYSEEIKELLESKQNEKVAEGMANVVQENEQLKQALNDLQQAFKEAGQLADTAEVEQRNEMLKQAVAEAENECSSLRQQLEEARQQISTLNGQLNAVIEQNDQLRSHVVDLSEVVHVAQAAKPLVELGYAEITRKLGKYA